MKNFTKQNFKTNPLWIRLLIMTFMLLAGAGTAWAKVVYFEPGVWDKDGAWFQAWVWGGSTSKWVTASNPSNSTYFEFEVADDATSMKILRKGPGQTTENWDAKWNNTGDINFNTDNKISITGWGENDNTHSCYPSSVTTTYNLNSSSGTTVKLSESQVGLNYDLYKDDNIVSGKTKAGSGSSLSWTISSAGTYTVKASNTCQSSKSMSGSYTYTPCYNDSDVAPGSVSVENNTSELCGSKTVKLTLSGTTTKDGLTKTIAWQSSTDNRTWTTISGQTGTTYSPTVSSTTYYRAKVTWKKSECNDIVEETSSILITVKTKTTLSWSTAPSSTMYLGDTKEISATLNPNAAGSVAYSSDKTNVVFVSNNTLTAKGTGTATITATPELNSNYCGASPLTKDVTVKALPVPSIIMKETITVDNQPKEVPATYTTRKDGDNTRWRAHLKWSSNATYNTVMVVRYAHGATKTAPTNGIAYSVNSTIGAGTVVCNGTANDTANECDDYGIEVGGNYDYYLYTVNNNYYSAASDAVNLNPRYTVAPDANLGDTQHEWWTDYFYMTKEGNVWSYTFNDKEAREYAFQIADGHTWENGWESADVDKNNGNISCESRTITNSTGTYTNIYFTTPTKGDITISYTENGGAYVTFTPDCITKNDVNVGEIKTIDPLCQGSSFTLEFATAPSDENTYTKKIEWQKDAGDGTFNTIETAETHTVTPSAGTHTYRAKVTWTCSWEEKGGTQKKCEYSEETQPIEVTVYATSVVNLTESAKTICIGESFKLSDFVDNTTTVGTVTWREGTETGNVVAGDALLSPSQTTNYYATAKNGVCGDSDVKTLAVTVKQRPAANDFDYTIADVNYDGNPHSVAVTWKNGGSEGITVYYNGEQEAPSAVGEYAITVKTTAHGDLCETTEPVGLGTLKIVCPVVPAPTIGEISNTYACNGTITAYGKVQIANYDSKYDYYLNGFSDKLNIATEDNKHYVKFEFTSSGNYKLYAKSNCGTSGLSAQFEIKYINTQPSVTAISINPESVCGSGEATIKVTGNDATSYKLYEKTGLYTFVKDFTGPTVTVDRTGTYAVKAINGSCIGTSLSSDVTFTINPIPNNPVLVNPDPICEGESFTLPEKDGNQKTITWVGVTNTTLTNLTVGEHTYTAKIVENGCSSNEVTYTVTVKTKPTVRISGNNSAFIYADVVLTATATEGATVKWYEGGVYKAEGLTYAVTSSTTGDKTVKAKAFLNGCESAEASYTVAFSAEDCAEIPSNDIQITFTHPEKNNNNAACQYWGFGYIFKDGVTPNNDRTNYLAVFPDKDATSGSKTVTLSNVQTAEIKVYLNAYHNYSECRASTKIISLERGNKYSITISSTQQGNGQWEKEATVTKTGSLTQPKPKSTPTVKTVSVETDPGEGNIKFKGQVVTTGCNDKAKLAVQYRLKDSGNDYTTYYWENNDVLVDIEPGKEFEITLNNIANGTYDVRARIYVDETHKSYGDVINVTVSTVKTPVSDAVINYSTMGGEIIEEPNTICKGSMAYIKLSYQGSQLDEIQWLVDGVVVENKIEQTSTTDLFVFTVSGTEKISARLKNAENTDWEITNELEYTMAPEPVSPTISLDRGTICSGETASLVLSSVKVGQSYQLFKQIENDGVYTDERVGDVTLVCTVDNEELKFTGLNVSSKYLVKAYNAECTNLLVPSQTATLDVINSADLKISIVPTATETTPWMPVKLTVEASGNYTITSTPNDAVINKISNDTYKVKLPLPEEADKGEDNTVNNVTFSDVNYVVEATLVSVTGEAQQCAQSAKSTITLKQYIEPCTQK